MLGNQFSFSERLFELLTTLFSVLFGDTCERLCVSSRGLGSILPAVWRTFFLCRLKAAPVCFCYSSRFQNWLTTYVFQRLTFYIGVGTQQWIRRARICKYWMNLYFEGFLKNGQRFLFVAILKVLVWVTQYWTSVLLVYFF